MIQPSSLYASSSPALGSLTPGLGTTGAGNAGNAGNAGTTGSVAGLTSPSPTQSLLANPAGGLTNPLGGGDMTSAITQILSMLMSIISALIGNLQQGGAGAQSPALDTGTFPAGGLGGLTSPAGGLTGGGAALPPQLDKGGLNPPAGGPAPANSAELIAGIRNKTTDPTQKQRLDTTLSKVAKDPDGAKLLQAAEAKGYTIEVGDPTQTGSQDHDADSVNGVTIPEQKRIVINPNAPDFDKTVVHELVHAATESDGNSQTEEGMADVIGYRVSSRMDGTQEPGSEQQIFQNKIKSYPNLNANNDILNSLTKLGIQP